MLSHVHPSPDPYQQQGPALANPANGRRGARDVMRSGQEKEKDDKQHANGDGLGRVT